MFVLALLVHGCDAPGPTPVVQCASVHDASETVLQLAASAGTQAKLLADLRTAPVPPPTKARFDRQGERHRTEAQHRGRFDALCTPLAAAASALAPHLPHPHDGALRQAADALRPACGTASIDTAAQLRVLVSDVDTAVMGMRKACSTDGTIGPPEDASPDPELRCPASRAVLEALLDPMGTLPADAAILDEQRDRLRELAAQPFDPDPIADSLTQLGHIEGIFSARCTHLVRLAQDHTRRHGAQLQSAVGQLRALGKRCERLPAFDPRADKPPTHEADAAEAGIAMRELYKATRAAYAQALTTCGPDAATPANGADEVVTPE